MTRFLKRASSVLVLSALCAAALTPGAVADPSNDRLTESPLSFRIGGAEFTPGGFLDFTMIFRSTGYAPNPLMIPFEQNIHSHLRSPGVREDGGVGVTLPRYPGVREDQSVGVWLPHVEIGPTFGGTLPNDAGTTAVKGIDFLSPRPFASRSLDGPGSQFGVGGNFKFFLPPLRIPHGPDYSIFLPGLNVTFTRFTGAGGGFFSNINEVPQGFGTATQGMTSSWQVLGGGRFLYPNVLRIGPSTFGGFDVFGGVEFENQFMRLNVFDAGAGGKPAGSFYDSWTAVHPIVTFGPVIKTNMEGMDVTFGPTISYIFKGGRHDGQTFLDVNFPNQLYNGGKTSGGDEWRIMTTISVSVPLYTAQDPASDVLPRLQRVFTP